MLAAGHSAQRRYLADRTFLQQGADRGVLSGGGHCGRGPVRCSLARAGSSMVRRARHAGGEERVGGRVPERPWDTPSRAFERGMGYCEQQLLALKHIYDQLGIEARPVFALRCTFPATVVDGMLSPEEGVSGHAWLRVRIGDEELDVCSGSVSNKPGVTHFEILSKVHTWQLWLRPFTHLGSSKEILGESTRPETLLDTLAELCKRRGHFCGQPKVSDPLSDDRGSGAQTPTDLLGQCEQVGRSLAHDDDLRTWLRDEEAQLLTLLLTTEAAASGRSWTPKSPGTSCDLLRRSMVGLW